MTSPTSSPPEEGWTVVTRRRRPSHFSPSTIPHPQRVKVFSPNSLTYAQALQVSQPPPRTTMPTQAHSPSHIATPTIPVTTSHTQQITDTNSGLVPQPTYVQSPHSPTLLRYPPNPNYKEWWGRCFRSTRKGHIVPECHYPRWHPNTPSTPRSGLQAARAAPTSNVAHSQLDKLHQGQSAHRMREEPSFEEFLMESEPQSVPEMPSNRPLKAQCYVNRDRQYFQKLDRLMSGIVVQPPEQLIATTSFDQIAAIIASSGKVLVDQLQVAIILTGKFLVLLPPNLNRDDVAAAIPNGVWDQGYQLHTYSPLAETAISIPLFKLWIDIEGVPLELSHESHMARAISSFGCYLGSMEPRTHGDCRTWSVFLATDDLAMVPQQLEFRVGGIVYTTLVHPRKWVQGQVYQRSDLPPSPITYRPTPSQFNIPQLASRPPSVPDPAWFQGDEVMHMSLRAMREIFRNVDPSELPPDLAECLAGNIAAIEAHNKAGREWEQQVSSKGKELMRTDTSPTAYPATRDPSQQAATVDPTQVAHSPASAHRPRSGTSRPSLPASLAVAETTHTSEATVHRTEHRTSRGKRTQDDLALQVCSPHFSVNLGEAEHSWEPRHLFPEISTPPNCLIGQTEPKGTTESNQFPPPRHSSPSRRPRRTTAGRLGKKNNGDRNVLDIDMQAFVNVPLQHAEGTELLAMIGAGQVSIPPHLMLPSQQQTVDLETGQTSKGPSKKKKQSGPGPQQATLVPTPTDTQIAQLGQQGLDDIGLMVSADAGPQDREMGLHENIDDNQEDDPYIDRVDYSDDDPLF